MHGYFGQVFSAENVAGYGQLSSSPHVRKKPLVLEVRLIRCKTETFGTVLVCPFQRGVRLIESRGSVTPVIIRK